MKAALLNRAGAFALVLAIGSSHAALVHAEDNKGDNGADWPMYNHDVAGTRSNPSEHTLGTSNVAGLHVLWQVPTPAPVSATPVVFGDTIFAGDMAGIFYAVRSDGTVLWSRQLGGAITASALATSKNVVVGDLSGNLYGLDRKTGAVSWQTRPDAHPLAAIFGSPTRIGNNVAIGVASNEEGAAANPNYPCCSTRGSLVLLNPDTGAIVWQTYTVTNAQLAGGASGASIWSTPTYDSALNLIYVTTGNNFTQPTTLTSDAIMAVNATTGAIAWTTQLYPNDEWNFRFPYSPDHPDADFGDSAQVYTLPGGVRVVGAGQKSGFYHVVDAASGQLLNQQQFQIGGLLGGLFADSAVAGNVVFANAVNWPNPSGAAPVAGDLIALSSDASQELWRFTTPFSPDFGGVAVANGVVYFASHYAGTLFALSVSSGAQLGAVSVGRSDSGPAVSRGRVYIGTGDAIAAGFGFGVGPGSITALGL